ncbi:hypothetical protein EYF80_058509 [Liparis tanakae]|uniref:Uncharacterized protein n=1 Tax=Liparis tanakae TaxID=230148 RepID=A0A4Z2ERC0_9TELE|nr:hypothetical protein EYF80_058509 [Liparis tanakae]
MPSFLTSVTGTWTGCRTQRQPSRKAEMSGTTHSMLSAHLEQTGRHPQVGREVLSRQLQHGDVATAVELRTQEDPRVTRPIRGGADRPARGGGGTWKTPPTCKLSTTGTGVTGEWTGPMPS